MPEARFPWEVPVPFSPAPPPPASSLIPWDLDPDAERAFAAAFAPERTIVRESPKQLNFEMPAPQPRANFHGSTMRSVQVVIYTPAKPIQSKTANSEWTYIRDAGLILLGVIIFFGILAYALSATIYKI